MAPILKPEGSLMAGLAVVALVWADYTYHLGSVATAHMSPANDPVGESSRKKAGYSALTLVAGVSLLAKDPNIFILGSAAIIAIDVSSRHALMSNPDTGQVEVPVPADYAPASSAG